MSKPEMLYHYTSLACLKKIIATGHIAKTCSNLRGPGKTLTEELAAYSFKPVVWMTDSTVPEGLCVMPSHQRIRFSIPMQRYYAKWNTWAKKNNMDPKWRKALTTGMNWQSWYISEFAIPLDDVSEILDTAANTIVERDAQGRFLTDALADDKDDYAQDNAYFRNILEQRGVLPHAA